MQKEYGVNGGIQIPHYFEAPRASKSSFGLTRARNSQRKGTLEGSMHSCADKNGRCTDENQFFTHHHF